MSDLAVFAKMYAPAARPDLLTAIRADGVRHVQFNLSCVGLPTLPTALDAPTCTMIRTAHHDAGITMVALSTTGDVVALV